MDMTWPSWVSYLTSISHLSTVLNSSVNFYIYSAKQRSRVIRHREAEEEGLSLATIT